MLLLRDNLPSVYDKNTLNSFFPVRTKDRTNVFDWDSVLGHVVKYSFGYEFIKVKDVDGKERYFEHADYVEASKKVFVKKLDNTSFWSVVDNMYFHGDELFKIAPEFLLFKTMKQVGGTPSTRLGDTFWGLMQSFQFASIPNNSLNFLEQELLNTLKLFIRPTQKSTGLVERKPVYLPFLSDKFQQDLAFLGKRPKYLLTVFKDFLKLYAHLYVAQLSLNLTEWSSGKPTPKPHYFILDSEKASDERTMVKRHGYKQLFNALRNIFPYLSMNESLQVAKSDVQPLWALYENIKTYPQSTDLLNLYAQEFKKNRELDVDLEMQDTVEGALASVLKLAVSQFEQGQSRYEINLQYVKTTESELCSNFIQSRGRAGRVMVVNQDYLVLLTNLAIGEQEKLRFHELIKAFESRGVFFDKQSQQALVEFFERIGNVERMSDSGDAVYVRKTI